MGIIKTYTQFINEGLFDKLNGKAQISEFQTIIIAKCEKEIGSTPTKFKNGESVLKYMKSYAEKKYKEHVTAKLAPQFSKWWDEFVKYYEPMLDEIIKTIKSDKYDEETIDDEEYYNPSTDEVE
jgi:hypothetical protein